jgi:hypothetical protein
MRLWRTPAARAGRVLAVAGLLALTLVVQVCGPSLARPHVTARYFGMHVLRLDTAWPDALVGAVDLTTNGVYWPQLQSSPGRDGFDFSRLDSLVDEAHAHHAQPLLVLGQTPRFASTTPEDPHVAATVPRMTAWRRYVHAVAARYGTRVDYQIWPEPNAAFNWLGGPHNLARLVVAAAEIIHDEAKTAVVVSPAMAVRKPPQVRRMSAFFAQKVGGVRVGHYVDAVAIDPYPLVEGTPEDSAALIRTAHHVLAEHKVTAPLWTTEINYGVVGAHLPVLSFPARKQAAYVMRTFLLNAANGVKRVYWLGWASLDEVAIQMVRPDLVTPSAAGRAYALVQRWMVGGTVPACVVHRATHVYACKIVRAGHVSRVYWTTRGQALVRAPKGSRHVSSMDGTVTSAHAGKRLRVTGAPIRVS